MADNPSRAVRKGEQLDWQALDAFLKLKLAFLQGEPEISQYPAGNSNLTYRLRYPDHDLVVRRPPFGTMAKSAHSMAREYRVMTALRPQFASVPEALLYSDDESVIGAEFYVMRRVEGQVLAGKIPAEWEFSKADTRRFCVAFWKKLIELHQVDYLQVGLEDFGKPQGYAQRQVTGWNRRFQNAKTPDVDAFEDLQRWLEDNIPAQSATASVLHGDYRIDNVILDARDPCKILAVLDWEICALGDPLMDLGNALAYWIEAGDPDFLRGLNLQPSNAPGMLSRQEILELYGQETGRDTTNFTFYYTYGMFRNAVILQQIYFRYFKGETQDKRFSAFGRVAQSLGEHCRNIIRESRE